ncbi:MAG: hypothetical protein LC808_18250 [Actinobacteria bacterium]|nr:hypothetical protein [Actinomycetota bacterium]
MRKMFLAVFLSLILLGVSAPAGAVSGPQVPGQETTTEEDDGGDDSGKWGLLGLLGLGGLAGLARRRDTGTTYRAPGGGATSPHR